MDIDPRGVPGTIRTGAPNRLNARGPRTPPKIGDYVPRDGRLTGRRTLSSTTSSSLRASRAIREYDWQSPASNGRE